MGVSLLAPGSPELSAPWLCPHATGLFLRSVYMMTPRTPWVRVMPIRQFIKDDAAFGPEALMAMSKAFTSACLTLKVKDDNRAREAIAVRIIELARQGEINAAKLAERVVREAGTSI